MTTSTVSDTTRRVLEALDVLHSTKQDIAIARKEASVWLEAFQKTVFAPNNLSNKLGNGLENSRQYHSRK